MMGKRGGWLLSSMNCYRFYSTQNQMWGILTEVGFKEHHSNHGPVLSHWLFNLYYRPHIFGFFSGTLRCDLIVEYINICPLPWTDSFLVFFQFTGVMPSCRETGPFWSACSMQLMDQMGFQRKLGIFPRARLSNFRSTGQIHYMLATPTAGLAKGEKVPIRHITLVWRCEFDTPAPEVLVGSSVEGLISAWDG